MAFLKPEDIVKQLPLEDGLVVADLGAGTGTFSIPIAKRIGKGSVYAVDVNRDILGSVKSAALRQGLTNVQIIWGNIETAGGTKLADSSVDLIVLGNVLFQTEDKDGVIKELNRILKHRGYAFVIDWKQSFGGLGPKQEHVLTEETVKKLFSGSGFSLYNEVNAGDYHYGFLFKKP